MAFRMCARRIATACYPLQQRQAGEATQMDLFDGILKAAHRDRAAMHPVEPDPLLDEVAERVLDRLEDCTRPFPRALILGGAGVQVLDLLGAGRAGVKQATLVDTSQAMLDRARLHLGAASWAGQGALQTEFVRADPASELLPVEPGQYDVVISCLGLHWVNDVPGVMAQCRFALKADGLFVGAMLGGTTLQEMRIACTLAQQEREGGVSPRVSPLAQVRDAGNLLTRAGLTIPTVDVDEIAVHYKDVLGVIRHLRSMGEGLGLKQRRQGLPRESALAAAAIYSTMFTEEHQKENAGSGHSVPATFQVVYMTGWAPDPAQKKAARRGSATVSFSDLAQAGIGSSEGPGG